MSIKFRINGVEREFVADPAESALKFLRRNSYLSVRDGCSGEGTCGLCSILLDGRLVNSCMLLVGQLEGHDVRTSESFGAGPDLDNIQKAFVESGIVQCGYCTSAMLLATSELLLRNPNPLRDEIKDAFSGIICRCTGYEQIYDAFEIIKRRSENDETFVFKHPEFCREYRHIGKYRQKIDAHQLLKSHPSFVEDMIQPNTLYLKVLRSPHAHAIVQSIDVSEAEKVPGVIFIATHENVPDIKYSGAGQGFPEPSPYDRRIINKKVRFVGDRVAGIAAESEEIALKAMELIKVKYEVLAPVFSIDESMKGKSPIYSDDDVHYCFPIGADLKKNMAASNKNGIGDVEKGFELANTIIERTYKTGHVQCTPLEPHIVQTYMEGDRLMVSASTQVPFHVRRIIATLTGLPQEKVRVMKRRVGGGFGAKQDVVIEDLASFITVKTGRPVYFRFDRMEEFVCSRTRHPTQITVKIGADNNGKITAVKIISRADTGPYGVHCLTVPMNAASKSLPLLRCPNMYFDIEVYYTNNVIAGAYQGYGAPAGSFALQMAIAELAKEMDMDYMDLVRLNHVRTGDRLDILKILGEGQEGIPQKVTSCGIGECLDIGSFSIGWNKKEKTDKSYLKKGKGFAIIQQGSGLPGLDSANAIVKMIGNGSFILLSGGADLGTGLDTVCAKVVAEVLNCDVDNISVLSGDTDTTPFDVGAYASSGTFFTGAAAMRAAEDMKKKILMSASEILEESVEDLEIQYPKKVVSKKTNNSVSFEKIAQVTQAGTGKGQLIGTAGYTTHEAPIPYGAHFAEVEVNELTGQVKVTKYHAYQDCGTPINPALAKGQMFGAALKSIGHSLCEEMIFDREGKCLNPNFTDYKVPTMLDIPEDFRAETVFVDENLGPFGGKSISEIATNASAPAIAVAIFNATGIWMREYPFTAERVLKAIKERDK